MRKLLLVISCIILLTTLVVASSGKWDIPNFWTLDGNTISTTYHVDIENMTIINITVTNHEINGTVTSTDWSNVTINESQIEDIKHTAPLWEETSDNYIVPVNATTVEIETLNVSNFRARTGNFTRWL